MDKKIVLLVEDNDDDVALSLRAFKKSNFPHEVVVARDGQEAFDYLFGTGHDGKPSPLPSLILLDLKLPRRNGLEVLQRIRHERRTKLLPVVVLTTSTEERDLIECYDHGANSYLRKPIDFSEFLEVVRRIEEYWLHLNQEPPLYPSRPSR